MKSVAHRTGLSRWRKILQGVILAGLLFLSAANVTLGGSPTPRAYLPWVGGRTTCGPVGQTYSTLPIEGRPSDRPVEGHPDINLAVRGYTITPAHLGLVDYGGSGDPNAPRLYNLFRDRRVPSFTAAYRVYDWDWNCNCRGNPIAWPEVTLLGLRTQPGEVIYVPPAGYTIGSGFQVLVLYTSGYRITLKYTREDNVVYGYTLHLEGVCVDPRLLALYQEADAAGRTRLPALRGGQPFGRAAGTAILVAIRDNGMFMDPRSRKDWW